MNRRSPKMNQLGVSYSTLRVAFGLMVADSLSFVAAGSLGLFFAIALGNASLPPVQDLLTFHGRERLNDFLMAGIAWLLWFQIIKNRYRRPIPFWSEVGEVTRVIFLMAMINLAIIALARNDYSRSIWFFGWLSLLPLIPMLRMMARGFLIHLGYGLRPTWIIGQGENAEEALLALHSEWQMGFHIQSLLSPATINQQALKALLLDGSSGKEVPIAESVFVIALDDNDRFNLSHLLQELTLAGAQMIHVIPALRGIPLYGAELTYFLSHEVLLLGIKNNLSLRFSKVLKRIFDVLMASVLMVPATFILFVAALFVWFEDQGPIFFVQERLGADGKTFRLIKLRTMRLDAERQLDHWRSVNSPEWQAFQANNFKLAKDPRLLRVGGFLRRTSIDELPQLMNVVLGEMSLVGPRPILARESSEYGKSLILYESTRPGMTGLWQVSGRSKTSFLQRATLDAWYIRNWSLGYDIVILLRTLVVVLSGRGAY